MPVPTREGSDHRCTCTVAVGLTTSVAATFMIVPGAEQAVRTKGEHAEKHQVTDELIGADPLLVGHVLGDAEHDAAEQGAPQRAEPADHHRLEREQQQQPAGRAV